MAGFGILTKSTCTEMNMVLVDMSIWNSHQAKKTTLKVIAARTRLTCKHVGRNIPVIWKRQKCRARDMDDRDAGAHGICRINMPRPADREPGVTRGRAGDAAGTPSRCERVQRRANVRSEQCGKLFTFLNSALLVLSV